MKTLEQWLSSSGAPDAYPKQWTLEAEEFILAISRAYTMYYQRVI